LNYNSENETHLKVLLKKLKFIKEIEVELGLKNITPIIETLTQSHKYLEKVVFNEAIDRNVLIELAKSCGQKVRYLVIIF